MNSPTCQREEVVVRPAEWPGDLSTAAALLRSYGAYLAAGPAQICIGNFEQELASLDRRWSAPGGVLLLAFAGERAAGCVAIKVRHDRPGACEMKRLWVESGFRGFRIGRRLTEEAIAWARSHGAQTLLLDTHPSAMPEAVSLYHSLGFEEVDRHNDNPVPGIVFMHLNLQPSPAGTIHHGT